MTINRCVDLPSEVHSICDDQLFSSLLMYRVNVSEYIFVRDQQPASVPLRTRSFVQTAEELLAPCRNPAIKRLKTSGAVLLLKRNEPVLFETLK